jgi:(S)-ureidoglycine aminohydrolase
LIAPDSFVQSGLPGWVDTRGIVVISPALGARFTQYLALMEPGGSGDSAASGIERVIYVVDGEVSLHGPGLDGPVLEPGGFAFCPPDSSIRVIASTPSRLNVFEKRYIPLPGTETPPPIFGNEQEVVADPFLGDPGAMLKTLLPTGPSFDLAVNLFTYRSGATLPMVEVHIMEHGLLMLEGQGVYRLDDSWYPVREGDVIWMAPYCPQWFVAMGPKPARYLYYKDVNRDPMAGPDR